MTDVFTRVGVDKILLEMARHGDRKEYVQLALMAKRAKDITEAEAQYEIARQRLSEP